MKKDHLYDVWSSMKRRCENPHMQNYAYYGAKGIKEAGFSVARISMETGIPHTTLLRKLKGVSEFKPSELFRIAKVTHLEPSLFVPPQFSSYGSAA